MQANPKDSRPIDGTVVAVRGSVVDARFEHDLPHINTVLRTGRDGEIVIEVLAQLDEHQVRGIALTPTQGLARGMSVQDTGEPLKAPVGGKLREAVEREFMNLDERERGLRSVLGRLESGFARRFLEFQHG